MKACLLFFNILDLQWDFCDHEQLLQCIK